LYKWNHSSYDALFKIRVIEYVFLEQINGAKLICECQILVGFLTSKKEVDLYADRLIREYIR